MRLFLEAARHPETTLMNARQLAIMELLYDRPYRSQIELARQLGMSAKNRSLLTRLIEVLERKGWASRWYTPNSKRERFVKLTDAGRAVLFELRRSAAGPGL